jgi:hypothetical protein
MEAILIQFATVTGTIRRMHAMFKSRKITATAMAQIRRALKGRLEASSLPLLGLKARQVTLRDKVHQPQLSLTVFGIAECSPLTYVSRTTATRKVMSAVG